MTQQTHTHTDIYTHSTLHRHRYVWFVFVSPAWVAHNENKNKRRRRRRKRICTQSNKRTDPTNPKKKVEQSRTRKQLTNEKGSQRTQDTLTALVDVGDLVFIGYFILISLLKIQLQPCCHFIFNCLFIWSIDTYIDLIPNDIYRSAQYINNSFNYRY